MTGYIIVIAATILYSILSPLLKKVSMDIQPWTSIALSMTVLTTIAYVMSLLTENFKNFNWVQNKTNILYLVVVGTVNAIAFYLGIKAYGYMPLWQQTMFGLLSPILTGIFAFYILGESMSWRLLLGLAIMSVGLFVSVYDFGKVGV